VNGDEDDPVVRSAAFDQDVAAQESHPDEPPRYVMLPANQYIRRNVIDFLLGTIIIFLLVSYVTGRIDQSNSAKRAEDQRQAIVATNDRLVDCTTPGPTHDCYNQAQAQTAAAIALIVDANHNGCPDVVEILNLIDPAHPQMCGPVAPPLTPPVAPPPPAPGGATTTTTKPANANGPGRHHHRPPFSRQQGRPRL
jgi:hypothetical protein